MFSSHLRSRIGMLLAEFSHRETKPISGPVLLGDSEASRNTSINIWHIHVPFLSQTAFQVL